MFIKMHFPWEINWNKENKRVHCSFTVADNATRCAAHRGQPLTVSSVAKLVSFLTSSCSCTLDVSLILPSPYFTLSHCRAVLSYCECKPNLLHIKIFSLANQRDAFIVKKCYSLVKTGLINQIWTYSTLFDQRVSFLIIQGGTVQTEILTVSYSYTIKVNKLATPARLANLWLFKARSPRCYLSPL